MARTLPSRRNRINQTTPPALVPLHPHEVAKLHERLSLPASAPQRPSCHFCQLCALQPPPAMVPERSSKRPKNHVSFFSKMALKVLQRPSKYSLLLIGNVCTLFIEVRTRAPLAHPRSSHVHHLR